MIPYELRNTVQDLYRQFSNQSYDPKLSWVRPNDFVLDPLYQVKKSEYVSDPVLKAKPFILAGPEFN
jgi:hypothetical protein